MRAAWSAGLNAWVVLGCGSGLEGVEGIAALAGLRQLILAHNTISDTTPIAMHDHLEVSLAPPDMPAHWMPTLDVQATGLP